MELAVQVKQQLLKKKAAAIPESYLSTWVELFGKLSWRNRLAAEVRQQACSFVDTIEMERGEVGMYRIFLWQQRLTIVEL